MKHKAKRILPLLLSLAMLPGLLPAGAFAAGDVTINDSSFPDSNFRACVAAFDRDSDGTLSEGELSQVTEMDCSGRGIAEMTGLEHFTALTRLLCQGNQFTTLDLRRLPGIRAAALGTKDSSDGAFDRYTQDGNELRVDKSVTLVTRRLTGIEITTPPSTTTYRSGASFDPAGMVVTAAYDDNSTAQVSGYSFSPSGALSASDTAVTVSYTEGGVTGSVSQPITVNETAAASITVAFDPQGGTVSPVSVTVHAGDKLDGLPTPVREGEAFAGWYTAAEGGEKVDLSRTYAADTVLYARWTPPSITISFDPNGGTATTTSVMIHAGDRLESLPVPKREGYTFTGWYTEVASGEKVDLDRVYTETTVLYARWGDQDQADTVTVYFDAYGGEVTPSSVTIHTGEKLESLPTPVRSGHRFDGWYTQMDGGEKADPDRVYPANTTLYARWTPQGTEQQTTVTVTFDPNGGSVSPASVSVISGGFLSSLPTPVREGYAFEGWYTQAGGGEKVDLSRVYGSNTTLYAHWSVQETSPGQQEPAEPGQQRVVTVTFDPYGGTVSPASAAVASGGALTSLPTPTREGYTFDGWYTGLGSGEKVDLGRAYSENTTLYARWSSQEGLRVNPFTDVEEEMYYFEPVLWAVNRDPQITNGTSGSTFDPGHTCTRGQVVTFLWRAAGCPMPFNGSDNPFSDVRPGMYFYDAVLWAREQGITDGTGPDTFSPEEGCTRGQVVTFLHRYEKTPAPAGTENPFGDVAGDMYYYNAVLWAYNHAPRITDGIGPGVFSPEDTCTRGEIVTFLYRDIEG